MSSATADPGSASDTDPGAPYPANVEAAQAGYAARHRRCLHAVADHEYPPPTVNGVHHYGVPAIAKLALSRDIAAANAELRHVAAWYERPHPFGRDHRGECDFVASKLCLCLHHPEIRRHLEPATLDACRRFMLTQHLDSKHGSENHGLIFRVTRYLMGAAWPRETFVAYAADGATLAAEDREWLLDFLRFRAERGWGEFDSACYIVPDWEALTSLYDYAPDSELRRLTGMMLDLLLADMAVDSLDGMYGGAHGRIYPREALNHFDAMCYPLQYLYFGLGDAACAHRAPLDALLSEYRPHPLVIDIALNRPVPYENRERSHLHRMSDLRPAAPLAGSIRKLTCYTPRYILGCVQFQDPYPAVGKGDGSYAHHQQHQWDLSFATRPDCRVFTHHPGTDNEHNYWTGDRGCGCGHFFQHRTAVLALYDISTGQAHQFIHAYLPRAAYDEVREDGRTLFLRAGEAYAALTFMDPYAWVTDGEFADREVISRAARTGIICEVGSAPAFTGFDAFCAEMGGNSIAFDRDAMALRYQSRRAGSIRIDTHGTREVDGHPADLDYATYDCPYLQSAWRSGVVTLRQGDRQRVLDFRPAASAH